MPVELYFPTPIYYTFAKDSEYDMIQAELKTAVEDYKDQLGQPWFEPIASTFKYGIDVNINVTNTTPRFKDFILKHAEEYLKSPRGYQLMDSWYNISRKGDFMFHHSHSGYDISGVYYYQTNGEDGNIIFKSDSTGLKNSKFGSTESFYKPSLGLMLLFPSFLEHAITPNQTDDERISFSFNLREIR